MSFGQGSKLAKQAAWQLCQGDGTGDPSGPRGGQRQQDGGVADKEMFGHKEGPSVPAGKPESWGVWHTELPNSFQMQLPGQHCRLLCVSMRSRAPGLRCLPVGGQVEGQRDNENTNLFYGLNVVLGVLIDIENMRSLERCVGVGGKLNLCLKASHSLPF